MRDHLFRIAETADTPPAAIGVVEARVLYPPRIYSICRVLHIHSLYVVPEHRMRGVGQALMRSALEWGKRRRCLEAELSTLACNPARTLFEELGFEVVELGMRSSVLA
jgi:GNAT superfamily N-acetyltransferase